MLEPHKLTDNQLRTIIRLSRKQYIDRNQFMQIVDALEPQFGFGRKTVSEYLGNKLNKQYVNRKLLLFAVREIRKQQGDDVYVMLLENIGVETLAAA